METARDLVSQRHGTDRVRLVERTPLTGGVSGAAVERLTFAVDGPDPESASERVSLVVKQTTRRELDALELLAELAEPAVPRVLASWTGAEPEDPAVWIVLPWFPGPALGLVAEPPPEVGSVLARIHHRFTDTPDQWPQTFERMGPAFVDRALREFLPRTLDRLSVSAPGPTAERIRVRALAQADELLADETFVTALDTWPRTVIHADLYGLNVLRDASGDAVVIDWGTASIGPGMFDIAMGSSSIRSGLARAYVAEWHRIGGCPRDLEAELDWSVSLISTMFAAVVAERGAPEAALTMLDSAADAYRRLRH